MNRPFRKADEGRRWHMNDLLALELFICVLTILVLASVAVSEEELVVNRAQAQEAWLFLRPMQFLWTEENAVLGVVASDAIAYQRARGEDAVGGTEEGSALGSVRGLEALRQRAARQEVEARDEKKVERLRTGLSDGIPVAALSSRYQRTPAIIELRPARTSEEAPVAVWLCGREPPPAGWIATQAREPQLPDRFLPTICRPRKAP